MKNNERFLKNNERFMSRVCLSLSVLPTLPCSTGLKCPISLLSFISVLFYVFILHLLDRVASDTV